MNNEIHDSSYLKLKWNIQGLFSTFPLIVTELEHRINHLPENNTNEIKKVEKWVTKINQIDQSVQNIIKYKMVELEKTMNYIFAEPDLVVLSFVQPSVKNLFMELSIYFSNSDFELNFEPYLNMDKAAKVLALIGDAAIDLALVQILWEPNLSNVGELSEKRSNIASNKNLARICDKWNLYDLRINFDPNKSKIKDETINHTKGTIIEALFGVMYIEAGLDQIISSVVSLK